MRGMRTPAPPAAGRVVFLLLCGSLVLAPRVAQGADEPPGYLAAMGGEYIVVGRRPVGREGDRKAYTGKVRVEVQGREVRVWRSIDGVETRLVGGLEPALGGDAQVLRLRVPGGPSFTCLERGDLDNYLRLTCVWTHAAEPSPREPGLEAWFPTGAWADDQDAE
jgi:hypothetical protein